MIVEASCRIRVRTCLQPQALPPPPPQNEAKLYQIVTKLHIHIRVSHTFGRRVPSAIYASGIIASPTRGRIVLPSSTAFGRQATHLEVNGDTTIIIPRTTGSPNIRRPESETVVLQTDLFRFAERVLAPPAVHVPRRKGCAWRESPSSRETGR